MFFLARALKKHPVDKCKSLNSEVDIVRLEATKKQRVWTLAVPMCCVYSCPV